jgi:hypothetical protein
MNQSESYISILRWRRWRLKTILNIRMDYEYRSMGCREGQTGSVYRRRIRSKQREVDIVVPFVNRRVVTIKKVTSFFERYVFVSCQWLYISLSGDFGAFRVKRIMLSTAVSTLGWKIRSRTLWVLIMIWLAAVLATRFASTLYRTVSKSETIVTDCSLGDERSNLVFDIVDEYLLRKWLIQKGENNRGGRHKFHNFLFIFNHGSSVHHSSSFFCLNV